MKQHYNQYTPEDFEVWQILFDRQVNNLQGKSCQEYLDCLAELKPVLNANKVPNFNELNAALKAATGWEIEVVPGLIPVRDFFMLLSQKKFCSSTWLRKKAQLDYLEEPDMFHDIFGHIPLFMNKEYAAFAQQMGELGVAHADDESIIKELQRLYWFTIEFGLVKQQNQTKIYGAGIISSFEETNYVYSTTPEILPYQTKRVLATDFCNSEIQTKYYQLEAFEDLFSVFEEVAIETDQNKLVEKVIKR